tara:strand:+ start:2019 stop:3140 length:1122 start_codon:yes stop_codon:yes gene_type:complete
LSILKTYGNGGESKKKKTAYIYVEKPTVDPVYKNKYRHELNQSIKRKLDPALVRARDELYAERKRTRDEYYKARNYALYHDQPWAFAKQKKAKEEAERKSNEATKRYDEAYNNATASTREDLRVKYSLPKEDYSTEFEEELKYATPHLKKKYGDIKVFDKYGDEEGAKEFASQANKGDDIYILGHSGSKLLGINVKDKWPEVLNSRQNTGHSGNLYVGSCSMGQKGGPCNRLAERTGMTTHGTDELWRGFSRKDTSFPNILGLSKTYEPSRTPSRRPMSQLEAKSREKFTATESTRNPQGFGSKFKASLSEGIAELGNIFWSDANSGNDVSGRTADLLMTTNTGASSHKDGGKKPCHECDKKKKSILNTYARK